MLKKQHNWTIPQIIYAVLMSILLLGYLVVIAVYSDPTTTGKTFYFPGWVWILRLVTAGLAIVLGRLWKDKGFWILMAYLFLKLIRVAIPDASHVFTEGVSDSLLTGIWVFCACYGMAKVFSRDHLKLLLYINAIIWTIGMVVYSSIGIYAAWTDQWIYTIGGGAVWGVVEYGRLFLAYYVTVSGAVLSMSVTIALCGALTAKRKVSKLLFILSVIPMLIAMSLTDSRGAQVSAAAGMAVASGITMLIYLKQKGRKAKTAWPIAIAVTAAVFAVVVFACMNTITAFNKLRADGLLIPRALAEETVKPEISNRGFTGSDILTGRPDIWKSVIRVIRENPVILLWGTSIWEPMTLVNALETQTFQAAHCHCMPLMILLENGIPGLLLIGSFLVMAARRAFQLLKGTEKRWETMTIAVIAAIGAFELVECFTWLRSSQAPMLPFFFIAMGVLMKKEDCPCVSPETKKNVPAFQDEVMNH